MDEINELWEELKFEVGSIGNELLPADKREVLIGMGDRNADILFVGNDPKLYENENYKVESKSSGEFFLKLLDIAEYQPSSYYVTTLARREVRFKNFSPEDKEKLLDLLYMQIALIKPKIIVFLGKEAAQSILKREINFDEERGAFVRWRGEIDSYLTYEIETVITARNDGGKKSAIATNFWNDVKNIKARFDSNE